MAEAFGLNTDSTQDIQLPSGSGGYIIDMVYVGKNATVTININGTASKYLFVLASSGTTPNICSSYGTSVTNVRMAGSSRHQVTTTPTSFTIKSNNDEYTYAAYILYIVILA